MIEQRKSNCRDCSNLCNNAFSVLSDLEKIEERKRTMVFSRGETLFFQSDPADSFFCIKEGRVQVYRNSPGREHSFYIAGPGNWLGYRDVLLKKNYSHSARTLDKVVLCKMPATLLQEELQKNPAILRELLTDLARNWERSERQSYNLGARSVPERLADFLLGLPDREEETALPCTREIIGTLTGTSTETVIRTLSAFKARGWIDTEKSRVMFRKKYELERLVAES